MSLPGRVAPAVLALALLGGLAGCTSARPAEPAVMRTTAPPWGAPRDAISNIDAAGLRHVRLDATDHQHIVTMSVSVDGTPVEIPADIGIDKVRAIQAPVHTHEADGKVWLEGEGTEQVTLASFFQVWGVRFDDRCLGHVCGAITVTADGKPVDRPGALTLRDVSTLDVRVVAG